MSTVVYCCPFVPAEWIAAHGLRPCRIVPEERASGVELYAGICPFARAFAGSALAREDAAAIVVTTACDQMRRIADRLEERSPRPVFLMNVPATWRTPAARELYASELRRLGRFLVGRGGKVPSDESLTRTMLEQEAVCTQECVVQLSNRSPILKRMGHPHRGSGVPLALVGGPLLSEDFGLIELIGQAGGRVVLDGTETGERTWPGRFDRSRLSVDPFAELVRAYFDTIPDAFRRPDSLLHEWLRREIAARGVRGVILHRYVWCDNWHAQVQRLKETLGVPVLDLDGGTGGNGQTRTATRIEAFVEMLAMT